jgi:hypothetical protein
MKIEKQRMEFYYLRRSSMAFRFCLSCQVGDGSTGIADVIRPRRVCNGESTCRVSVGSGTNGRSSKALGNGGRISPSLVVGGNCDTRFTQREKFILLNKEKVHLTS